MVQGKTQNRQISESAISRRALLCRGALLGVGAGVGLSSGMRFGRPAHASTVGTAEIAEDAHWEAPIMQQLRSGSSVGVGDRIITGAGGRALFGFNDGTELSVGPKADIVLDDFLFGSEEGQGRFGLSVLGGAFRYISGAIGKMAPQNVVLDLPVATIGIRGTHVLAIIEPNQAGCIVLLPDPRRPGEPTALTVTAGGKTVVVDREGWGTDVPGLGAQPTEPKLWESDRVEKMIGMSGGFPF